MGGCTIILAFVLQSYGTCHTTVHSLQSQRDIAFYKQIKNSKKNLFWNAKNVLLKHFITWYLVFSFLPGLIVNTMLFRLDLHTPSKVKYIWWKDFVDVFKTFTLLLSTPVPMISIICVTSNAPIWCGENEIITSWKRKLIMRHTRQ